MTESTQLAIVALVSAVVTPIITAWVVRRGKQQDYDRADKIAKMVAESANQQGKKLDEIKHLSNGSLTAAMQGELAAVKSKRLLLEGVPNGNRASELAEAKRHEADVEARIVERVKATTAATAERESPAPPKEV